MAPESERDARVLVIFPGALGDLLCLIPALRALMQRHRGAALELMAREELARFAVGRIGLAVGVERRRIARGHSIDRREVAALFAEDSELDEAVRFFRPFARIYSFFAGDAPRFRQALEVAAVPGAVSFHRFRPAGGAHIAAAYLDEIGESASAPPDGASHEHIEVLPDDIGEARDALARLGLKDSRLVLLFPGSGAAHKNWPAENFAILAGLVPAPFRPLVVLGPAERSLEPLFGARGVARIRDLPLGTVVGLAHFAAAFVGNDSGVSHLAAAVGTPGIAIFGPTDPGRWRPLGRVRVVRATRLGDLMPAEAAAALRELTAAVEFWPTGSVVG